MFQIKYKRNIKKKDYILYFVLFHLEKKNKRIHDYDDDDDDDCIV